MCHHRLRLLVASVVVAGFLCAGPAISQPGPAASSGPAGVAAVDPNLARAGAAVRIDPNQVRAGGAMAFDANQWRQAQRDRLKEQLGVTEEELSVLEPKMERVRGLQGQLRARRMASSMMISIGAWGGQGAAPEPTELDKAAKALAKVLANKDAAPSEIKLALDAYREARAKVKAELEQAQKDLKERLTVRQEAQIKQMGLLD